MGYVYYGNRENDEVNGTFLQVNDSQSDRDCDRDRNGEFDRDRDRDRDCDCDRDRDRDTNGDFDEERRRDYYDYMNHVHEYSESVKLAENGRDRHNHRAAGVTGKAKLINEGRNHVHEIERDLVDSFGHVHRICTTTGPAVRIPGSDKHVHLICGRTTEADEHCHRFEFTTQVDSPLI